MLLIAPWWFGSSSTVRRFASRASRSRPWLWYARASALWPSASSGSISSAFRATRTAESAHAGG